MWFSGSFIGLIYIHFLFISLFPPWMLQRMEINKYWLTFIFFFSTFLQYFLPFATEGIKNQIEQAIHRADKIGVKVISLGALNKVWHIELVKLLNLVNLLNLPFYEHIVGEGLNVL